MSRGRLCVVGIGPGSADDMTLRARAAVEVSDTVVGYTTYIKLVEPLLAGKQVISTGMMKEAERCAEAVRLASDGRKVALVSSGDAGIYGMAGLVLEIVEEKMSGVAASRPAPTRPSPHLTLRATLSHEGRGEAVNDTQGSLPFDFEVIPGVPAVCSSAASLGAPLMHDFAVISLSDLLTPWELIVKRLESAASADFVIALYNPRSKGRPGYLGEARDIILKHRPGTTPVGIAKDSTREGERVIITTLGELPVEEVDMTTMVIVGNSSSRRFMDYILTPRGYKGKRI